MFAQTMNIARKYGAKAAAATGALALSTAAMAQATTGEDIVAKVEAAMGQGEKIAIAVVLGLFVIFGVKLLWRSK